MRHLLLVLSFAPFAALAGGSNYGVAPGAKALTGKISEWPVPTPKFARDPAIGPVGNIYIAVMQGNRIARFDTKAQTFTEWDLPPNAKPHGLHVDAKNIVWYTGNGRHDWRARPEIGPHPRAQGALGRRSAHAGDRRRRRHLVHGARRRTDRAARPAFLAHHRVQDLRQPVRSRARQAGQ